MCKEIFDETFLRGAIIGVWGEYGAHVEVYDMLLKKLNELLTPPPDAAVREAVERLDNSEYTISLDGSQDDTKQMWEDIDTLIAHARAVQSPRLTPEQVEAVKEAKEVFAISGDVKLANRLEAAFPEAFSGESTTWTCGICGEKRPDCVEPVLDEECGDACPEHYEAGEVGCG